MHIFLKLRFITDVEVRHDPTPLLYLSDCFGLEIVMARFLKIDNTIINVDSICAVVERYERVRVPPTGDKPFDDYASVVKGVNVFFGTTLEDSFIPFADETIDSFLKKIGEVA